MDSISRYLGSDHHHCDDLFAQAEDAAARRDWAACEAGFRAFAEATAQHFRMEEEVLFPALEAHTNPLGPTRIMRMEHRQMEELLEDMKQALAQRRAEDFLGGAETLLIMMQQHNLKEEQVLYPMADQVLQAGRAALIARMDALAGRTEAVGHG
ncbi:MAG: hemerythrin domain-containing protein [Pseudomonadota bacterium]